MNTKERLEDRLYKLESKLYNSRKCKNESLPFTTEDSESLRQIIEDRLDSLHECEIGCQFEIDITDDNADYGYLNIGIYNPNYITDYDIVQEDVNSFKVINNDDTLEADSLDDAAHMLCDHFIENYVNGKFQSKVLESRLAKLERMLLGTGDSVIKDALSFSKNIEQASDLLNESLNYWSEGLVLSPAAHNAVKADLIDIITKSKNILRGLM